MKGFILDGAINSYTDLGLRITLVPVIPSSQRVIEDLAIDGREGTLTLFKGWEDISFSFKAAITNKTTWNIVLPQILNAQTITFTNEPTVHFKVKYIKVSGLTQLLSNLWEFEIEVTTAPFRYLNNFATINRTSSGTVQGYGNIYSLPKITVYGIGSRTLTINGKAIVLNILNGYLIIDSELKECYYGNVAQNQNMTGDFPVLNPSSNQVTLGTGITKVEIDARWRMI
ncbi:MAG: phage tail protein [Streptococcaceae bacterium]|jgi:phage-related protein|nr:phage tail protein [Streptococcaceae bacterium]